jgi:hypothetical protein
MINYDTDRGVTVTKDVSGSTLNLKLARTGDSGNYTCSPYNIRPASVLVHVLSEGNSAAAVQNGGKSGDPDSTGSVASGETNPTRDRTAPPSAAVQSSGASEVAAASKSIALLLFLASITTLKLKERN